VPAERVDPLQEAGAQRLIVLQLLRVDHDLRWSRHELERELHDISPAAIGVALERLQAQGVAHQEGEHVWASPGTRHLDALWFICI
jgi:hypothetical protein